MLLEQFLIGWGAQLQLCTFVLAETPYVSSQAPQSLLPLSDVEPHRILLCIDLA